MMPHPSIRILLMLAFATYLAFMPLYGLALCTVLILGAFLLLGEHALWELLRAFWRIRFLLLSIAIVYFWFTPGIPLWGTPHAWMPTWEGLREGVYRAVLLMEMLAAVTFLLFVTSRRELIEGLFTLVRPLALFGIDPGRFARRVVWTLDSFPKVRTLVAGARNQATGKKGLHWLAETAAGLVRTAEIQAQQATENEMSLPPVRTTWPAWWHWLYLPAWIMFLAAIKYLTGPTW